MPGMGPSRFEDGAAPALGPPDEGRPFIASCIAELRSAWRPCSTISSRSGFQFMEKADMMFGRRRGEPGVATTRYICMAVSTWTCISASQQR